MNTGIINIAYCFLFSFFEKFPFIISAEMEDNPKIPVYVMFYLYRLPVLYAFQNLFNNNNKSNRFLKNENKMPIVIALDVSVSMCRPISVPVSVSSSSDVVEDEIVTRKKLAVEAINQFLDHISSDCKLEFVSLVSPYK